MNIMQSPNTGVGKELRSDHPEIEDHYRSCIGVDGLMHVCLPWEKVTKCGIRVRRKKIKDIDYHLRFSCYECTY